MTNEPFMKEVACEEEITMDDIRRVVNYRDNLIVELTKRVKSKSMTKWAFHKENDAIVSEIDTIHVWLKQHNQ